MKEMPTTDLEGSFSFPLSAKKKRLSNTTVAQLWDFLGHSLNLKKEFIRASFDNHVIRLYSKRHWFRISARNGLEIFLHVSEAERTISEANRHGELILGYLNTLHRDEFKHLHIVGNFSSDDRKIAPAKGSSLIDRSKLVQVGNKLKTVVRPAGQVITLERGDENWLAVTLGLDHDTVLGLFYHITKDGTIPSDLIRSMLETCLKLGKQIKSSLSRV